MTREATAPNDAAPRPLDERTSEVDEWLSREAGVSGGRATLLVLLYLEAHRLTLADLRVHRASDPNWPSRSVRTPAERLAKVVSHTQRRGQTPAYVFVMPREVDRASS